MENKREGERTAKRSTKVKVKYYFKVFLYPKMFVDEMNKNKAGENMGPL